MALVVVDGDTQTAPSKKELLALLHEFSETGVISKQMILTQFKFVDAIDKTSVGKVDKKSLRQKYL